MHLNLRRSADSLSSVRGSLSLPLVFLGTFFLVAFALPTFSTLLCLFTATFGYAIFWYALSLVGGPRVQFLLAALWYGSIQLIQFSWICDGARYQGLFVLALYLSVGAIGGLFFALFTCALLKNNLNLLKSATFCAIWTLGEWGRGQVACGFPINPMGMPISSSPYSLQLASIGGPLFLTFLLVFSNIEVLRLIRSPFRGALKIFLAALIFLLPQAVGFFLLKRPSTPTLDRPVSVALVQTALLPCEKLHGLGPNTLSLEEQWGRIFGLLGRDLDQKIDLLILPENALPCMVSDKVFSYDVAQPLIAHHFGEKQASALSLDSDLSNGFFGQMLANFYGAHCLGGFSRTDGAGLYYTSCFCFVPNSEKDVDFYDKRKLVPGEYLLFDWCRGVAAKFNIRSFFEKGSGPRLFSGPLPGLVISPSICYDEFFSEIVREGRCLGANILLNITNDGWYPGRGPFSLPEQHYSHARLRAVELGAPLLRCCNTGVTAIIDENGAEIARLPLSASSGGDHPSLLLHSFMPRVKSTLYTLWGDLFVLLLSCAIILLSMVLRLRRGCVK